MLLREKFFSSHGPRCGKGTPEKYITLIQSPCTETSTDLYVIETGLIEIGHEKIKEYSHPNNN